MPPLLDILAYELERPRNLPAQVIHHLVETHGVSREHIGEFLVRELPKLEEYEVDLALSALFTPTLRDQAVFAQMLGCESIPAAQWPALVQQLAARPTRAPLVTEDARVHLVLLREVTIERFVHRLRLDGRIPEPLFESIVEHFPAADHPLLQAIARRAVWEQGDRGRILERYLTMVIEFQSFPAETGEKPQTPPLQPEFPDPDARAEVNEYRLKDAVALLRLVETYQPEDLTELLALIPHWQQVLRQEIGEAAGARPFFNERVQEMHGGGRDQRGQDTARITAKEDELALLARLQRMLAG